MLGIILRKSWFKPSAITDEVNRQKKKFLGRASAYIRKIARDFVHHKSNPNKYSQPYHSPYDHFGLKKSIVSATDDDNAYIGPRLIRNGMENVARRHEFGGKALVKPVDAKLANRVNIGDVAPVSSFHMHRLDRIVKDNGEVDPKTGRKVVWIKIRTSTQAKHSLRLYRRLIRHSDRKIAVTYPPRPFMFPALKKSLPYLPKLWQNSIH